MGHLIGLLRCKASIGLLRCRGQTFGRWAGKGHNRRKDIIHTQLYQHLLSVLYRSYGQQYCASNHRSVLHHSHNCTITFVLPLLRQISCSQKVRLISAFVLVNTCTEHPYSWRSCNYSRDITKPHLPSLLAASAYYVDEAYCYRRNSVVCLSVGLSQTIILQNG